MKRILSGIATFTLLVTIATPVLAQDSTVTSSPQKTRSEQAPSKTADRQEKLNTRKEAIASMAAERKAKMASRSAQLKAALTAFKDQRKAAIAEKVNTNLNSINEKRTAEMNKHLDKMTELLNKLSDRVAAKKAAGKDTTQAEASIASASASIAAASSAVDAQAAKDYTISVSTESAVRTDAKTARDKLHTDLEAVRKLVIAAKQAISNAVKVAATTLGGIGDGKRSE